ncbi:hypothetical protein MNB_ARC-1_851 [hydrothermal vent metagenome]|uniref:Uncharacterized protein n=1 Tax=hydrothermal vent metagenome TaxID=652676 RepID=A0A3B1DW91_9ZZZZ
MSCYKCGLNFYKKINIKLDFLISNGIYNGDDKNVMYECINSVLNLEEIINSEIEIVYNDYNSCEKCKNTDNVSIDI